MILVIRNELQCKERSAPVPCAGISMKSWLSKSLVHLAYIETPSTTSGKQHTENARWKLSLNFGTPVGCIWSQEHLISPSSLSKWQWTSAATCLVSMKHKLDRNSQSVSCSRTISSFVFNNLIFQPVLLEDSDTQGSESYWVGGSNSHA